MNTLKCPGCEKTMDSPFKAAPCHFGCGRIAKAVALDGAFEQAVEGEEIKKPKAPDKKKPEADTSHRPAEDGGRTF
jgi:hypothetical protein